MARLEAKRPVEALGVNPGGVGGELHAQAALCTALPDRPFEHLAANAGAAQSGGNTDPFDLTAPTPDMGDTGEKGELQAAEHLSSLRGHRQKVIGVRLDRIEGGKIARVERFGRLFPRPAEHVVGKQGDDCRQVCPGRAAKDHGGHWTITGYADNGSAMSSSDFPSALTPSTISATAPAIMSAPATQ